MRSEILKRAVEAAHANMAEAVEKKSKTFRGVSMSSAQRRKAGIAERPVWYDDDNKPRPASFSNVSDGFLVNGNRIEGSFPPNRNAQERAALWRQERNDPNRDRGENRMFQRMRRWKTRQIRGHDY